MKTITYYPTMFHTNPFAHKWSDIYSLSENNAKGVVLQNDMVGEKGISEMIVNITAFAAIDENGREHRIKDFPQGNLVNLKGTHSGRFIRTNSAPELDPGTYCSFRFYLGGSANTFILKDRSEMEVSGLEYIDFEIMNGLKIDGEDKKPVIMRFDFEPFTMMSFLNPMRNLFKKQKSTSRNLTECLSS